MCRQHGRARRRQRWLHGVTTRAGWPTGDDRQSRVRAGLSLLLVLLAAALRWHGQAGGRLGHLGAARLTQEQAPSVAMGLSPYGCMRACVHACMVAELLLGHQTPCMLPRSIPSVLFDSGGLCGPPWLKKWVKNGVIWRRLCMGIRTPYAPRTQGGSYIGRGPLRLIKSFSHAVFCAVYSFLYLSIYLSIHNGSGPNHGSLKTTCHRLRKRWDENTPLNN